MIYGILILLMLFFFLKMFISVGSWVEIVNKVLFIYFLFFLGIVLYVFLIVFFNFYLGNFCWLFFFYIGGLVFVLIVLVNGVSLLIEKMN